MTGNCFPPYSAIVLPPTMQRTTQKKNVNAHPDADTYGWDTVCALSFATANRAIASSWASVDDRVKKFVAKANDDPSYHISGEFGPWQLTVGGDGKNVRMACPVTSGTYQAGPKKTFDLAGMELVIEVGMEWVPDPGQPNFSLEGDTVTGIIGNLDRSDIDPDLQRAFADHAMPLAEDASVTVKRLGTEWLITSGKLSYYLFQNQDKQDNQYLHVYQFEQAWKNNLKLLDKESAAGEPAVVLIQIRKNPTHGGIPGDVLPGLCSSWFNTNIDGFNHVFASLDLSPALAPQDRWKWIKPTSTSYAVTDEGTLETSIFGVLTAVGDRLPGQNHQVSPFAIPSGQSANGADVGFLISGPMFMKNMMLAGARTIFGGVDESNFSIDNDYLSITNNKDLVWGRFKMDDKKLGSLTGDCVPDLDNKTISESIRQQFFQMGVGLDGYEVQLTSPGTSWLLTRGDDQDEYLLELANGSVDAYRATVVKVGKHQFKMTLDHSELEIQFVDLVYSYNSDFDVHIDFTERLNLNLQEKNGKKIFWYEQASKSLVVQAVKTKSAITREIVEGAIFAALSLIVVAGPLLDGLRAAATVGEVTEEAGTAVVDAEAFAEVAESNPEAVIEDEAEAGSAAASETGGRWTAFKGAFGATRWKVAAAVAAVVGGVFGVEKIVSAITEAAAKDEWENVPGFDEFANQAIAPYSWPGVAEYELRSAWLAGSLQVGLKAR